MNPRFVLMLQEAFALLRTFNNTNTHVKTVCHPFYKYKANQWAEAIRGMVTINYTY